MALEKTLESPLDSKEIKPVNPIGNQPWIFIERTDVEAEALILWPPDAKSLLIGKDPDAGKDWRQKEKGAAEGEMVRQPHQLNGHEFEQTLGDGGGQRSLVCYSPWVIKSQIRLSDWTTTNTSKKTRGTRRHVCFIRATLQMFQTRGSTRSQKSFSSRSLQSLRQEIGIIFFNCTNIHKDLAG